jgi:hypothetical protein
MNGGGGPFEVIAKLSGSEYQQLLDLSGELPFWRRTMADETDFRQLRVIEDFKASNEAARAATQAAILINGGAATALLAFLSKGTPTPPFLMRAACVSLGLYALGGACGTLSTWYAAQALGLFGSAQQGFLDRDKNAPTDLANARKKLESHKRYFPLSLVLFFVATVYMAIRLS